MAKGYSTLVGRSRKKYLVIGAVVLAVLILLIVIIYFATKKSDSKDGDHHPNVTPQPQPQMDYFSTAAVVADSLTCSTVGKDVLKKNGTAVDAAVAAMFCTGVIHMQSTGIGGGGFMVAYLRGAKTTVTYDYREVAPLAATADMYLKNGTSSRDGPLAVGVPGEVKGLYHAHQMHGKLTWAELIEPSIKLLEDGFPIGKALGANIKSNTYKIRHDPGLSELLRKSNGEYLKEGDTLRDPKLAATFREIQRDPHSFYNGSLAADIANDFQNTSGIITEADLKKYSVVERPPLTNLFGDMTMRMMPPPSGGVVVAMIMNIIKELTLQNEKGMPISVRIANFHKMIEAMKFSFARRGFLGDSSFLSGTNITEVIDYMLNKTVAEKIVTHEFNASRTFNISYYGGYFGSADNHGTAHVSVLDKDGNAVSATGSVNYWFGCGYRSMKTGIIYNNEMDDFSTPGKINLFGYPATKSNFIEPGKRPLSSMSPLILTDRNDDVVSVIGAAGGSKIITSVAQVLARTLVLGEDLESAVESTRVHHQLSPNIAQFELKKPILEEVKEGLRALGHDVRGTGFISVVQAILKMDNKIYAHSDSRKGGKAAGY